MEKMLRGQPVEINMDSRSLKVVIHKPMRNSFSISDKIFKYLGKGYIVNVALPKREMSLTKENKHFLKEEVKSKFPGAASWYRYWYQIPQKQDDQKELF